MDRVVGGLTGGVPEPPVDRARLDEVEDVPGRPEQHARAARDEARRAASCGDQCEHSREDDRQRERGAELRRQGEAERDASQGELRPRATREERRRGQEERRDDEIVQDRGAVQENNREVANTRPPYVAAWRDRPSRRPRRTTASRLAQSATNCGRAANRSVRGTSIAR